MIKCLFVGDVIWHIYYGLLCVRVRICACVNARKPMASGGGGDGVFIVCQNRSRQPTC